MALKTPGLHSDGGGLFLRIDERGFKRWTLIFQWYGQRKEMGLGSFSVVSLAEARKQRDEARKLLREGQNPIEVRRHQKAREGRNTFGEFSSKLIDELEQGWRNDKHKSQWRNTLRTYAASIWDKPIDAITTDDVLKVLRPIWLTKAETARRVRMRLERVFDAAKAKGLRSGDNPARWRGHLQLLMAPQPKLQRGHHPAMDVEEVPAFMAALAKHPGRAARALEFAIATACREGEVLGARWEEISEDGSVWIIPAERMKAGREHRVPLNAVAILAMGQRPEVGGLIFPGPVSRKAMSNMAMDMLLRRMKLEAVTVHGFRSTFRDWAGDHTDYPREVVEQALAHQVGSAVERAYRRRDAFNKREALMSDWSNFLLGVKQSASSVH